MAGHRLEVVGAVEESGAVEGPARGLHEGHVLGLGHVAGALEHDVLEQMREAGLARDLVLGADVVPDVDRHDRRQVVFRDDQAKAVGEAFVCEPDARDGHAIRFLKAVAGPRLFATARGGGIVPAAAHRSPRSGYRFWNGCSSRPAIGLSLPSRAPVWRATI